MPSTLTPNEARQFDARTASLVVDGDPISDLEAFGYDQAKDHELQWTVAEKAVWIDTTPEVTGTFVMLATSSSIPRVENIFQENITFQITAQPAASAGHDQPINFVGCRLTDFSMSDYEVGGIPTLTGEWQGVNRSPVGGGSGSGTPSGDSQSGSDNSDDATVAFEPTLGR